MPEEDGAEGLLRDVGAPMLCLSGNQRWRWLADERLADSGPEALCRGDVLPS